MVDTCKPCGLVCTCNDKCIQCFKCKIWHHDVKCVNLTNNQINVIRALGDCVEWFCPECTKTKEFLASTPTSNNQMANHICSDRIDSIEKVFFSKLADMSTQNNDKSISEMSKIL